MSVLSILGLAAVAIGILVRLRWKWAPSILLGLGIVLAANLMVMDAVPEIRWTMAPGVVFIGGCYLMALLGLGLRSLGEK